MAIAGLAPVGCGGRKPAEAPPTQAVRGMKLVVGGGRRPGDPPLDQGPAGRVGGPDRRRAGDPATSRSTRSRLAKRRRPRLPRRPDGRPRRPQGAGHPARLGSCSRPSPTAEGERRRAPKPPPDDLAIQGHRARLPRPGDQVRPRPRWPCRSAARPWWSPSTASAFDRPDQQGGRQGRRARPSSRPRPGSSSTPWRSSSTAATGTATASPNPASRSPGAPTPKGSATRRFLARAAALGLHRDQFSFLLDSETTEPRVTSPPFVEALEGVRRPEGVRPARRREVRCRRRPQGVPLGRGRPPDRPGRARGDLGHRGRAGRRRPPARLASGLSTSRRNAWEDPKTPNRPSYLPHGGGWLVGVVASTARSARGRGLRQVPRRPRVDQPAPGREGLPDARRPDPATRPGAGQPPVRPRGRAPRLGRRGQPDPQRRPSRPRPALPRGDRLPRRPRQGPGRRRRTANPPSRPSPSLAKAWTERTKALGQARQTWHHRRSLNGLVTPPEPPAR